MKQSKVRLYSDYPQYRDHSTVTSPQYLDQWTPKVWRGGTGCRPEIVVSALTAALYSVPYIKMYKSSDVAV
jgi:hypothetical protein